MKRSKAQSSRAMRQRYGEQSSTRGTSKYASKVKAKKQLYGPGCCAHNQQLS